VGSLFSSKASSTYDPLNGGAQSQTGEANSVQVKGGKNTHANIDVSNTYNLSDYGSIDGALDLSETSLLVGGTMVSDVLNTAGSAMISNMGGTMAALEFGGFALDRAISANTVMAAENRKTVAGALAANSNLVSESFAAMNIEQARNDALTMSVIGTASQMQMQTMQEANAMSQYNNEAMAQLAAGQQVESLSRQNLMRDLVEKVKWPVFVVIGLVLYLIRKR